MNITLEELIKIVPFLEPFFNINYRVEIKNDENHIRLWIYEYKTMEGVYITSLEDLNDFKNKLTKKKIERLEFEKQIIEQKIKELEGGQQDV